MRNTSVSIKLGAGIVAILALVNTARAFSGSGSGTEQDPFVITNISQLQEMNDDLDAWYELGNDIDASDTINWNGGAGFIPIGREYPFFSGAFDGNGFKITGLYIDRSADYDVGLFALVYEGGLVQNVGVEDVDITGFTAGGLVGTNSRSTILNSYSTGIVIGNNGIGGLVGSNHLGSVLNCYSSVGVSSDGNQAGGLVGNNWDGAVISDSYSTGSVNGSFRVGGLVGRSYGSISNSYSTASVSGSESYTGGLVGHNYGSISNSYSTGTVNGTSDVGGLIGLNHYGSVSNSYSRGNVSGTGYVGGLVGDNYYSSVSNSYASGSVSGTGSVGGLVGHNWDGATVSNSFWDTQTSGQMTSDGGAGRTTAEMQTKSTFTDVGWDFVDIWDIIEGVTYPFLGATPPEFDSATIVSYDPPTGTLDRGDVVQATVTVKNTGSTTRSFWVGLSFAEPEAGEWPEGWYDIPPSETDSLGPGQEQIVTFEFSIPIWLPAGSYDAVTAVWDGYDELSDLMTGEPFAEATASSFSLDYDPDIDDLLDKVIFPPIDIRDLDEEFAHTQHIDDVYTATVEGIRFRLERDDEGVGPFAHGRIRIFVENGVDVLRIFGAPDNHWASQLLVVLPNDIGISSISTNIDGDIRGWQEWGINGVRDVFALVGVLGGPVPATVGAALASGVFKIASEVEVLKFKVITSVVYTDGIPVEIHDSSDSTQISLVFDSERWGQNIASFNSFELSFDVTYQGPPKPIVVLPDIRFELQKAGKRKGIAPVTWHGTLGPASYPQYEYRRMLIIYPSAIEVDHDGDGISDRVEIATDTDPFDDDTDDDGLLDGPGSGEDTNANGVVDPGETDPRSQDTDGDGIQDGTERALTAPEGLDTDMAVFVPDSDPDTTTDPTNPDTDGDGLLDGEEDLNGNGAVDNGELDPAAITGTVSTETGVLSLAGKKKWLTCYIELPTVYDVSEIDVTSLILQNSLNAKKRPSKIDDYDHDGALDLMVRFDRKQLIVILEPGEQIIVIRGQLADGTPLEAIGIIEVLFSSAEMSTHTDELIDLGEDGAYDLEEAVAFALFEAGETIGELDSANFSNEDSAAALASKIDTVLWMMDEGLLNEALDVLESEILERTNGCADIGEPDENDCVTSCEGQEVVHPLILEAIELLESFI